MSAPLPAPSAVAGAVASLLFTLSHAASAQEEAPTTEEPDQAQDEGLPVRQAARPLILPHLELSPLVAANVYHHDSPPELLTMTHLQVGAAIGLGDVVEVEVLPMWLAFSWGVGYAASLGVTGRYLDDDVVELGARARALASDEGAVVNVGLPVRLHAGRAVRVDTGVHLNVDGFTDSIGLMTLGSGDLLLQPGVPVEVVVSPAEVVFVGARTGFGIVDLERAADTTFVPVGLSVGGTIPVDDRPLLDVSAGVSLPAFLLPGRDEDPVSTELFSVQLLARAYVDLGG